MQTHHSLTVHSFTIPLHFFPFFIMTFSYQKHFLRCCCHKQTSLTVNWSDPLGARQQILSACGHPSQDLFQPSALRKKKQKKPFLLWQLVKTVNNKPLTWCIVSDWVGCRCMYVGRIQPGNRWQGSVVTSDTVSETRETERGRQKEREREGGETGGATTQWWLRGRGPTEQPTYLQDSWLIPCMK